MIAAVAALALAGCGGGGSAKAASSATTPTSTTTPGGGRGFQNAAFTTCLQQHGVTLPAGIGGGGGGRRRGGSGGAGGPGGPGGRGPNGGSGRAGGGFFGGGAGLSAKQQAAFAACQSKLPNGGRFGGGRGFAGGADATQLKAYMSCLSDHGVKVPTTTTSTPAGGSGSPRFVNPLASVRNDPHFAAASKQCAPLLPTRGTRTPTPPAAG